MTILRNLVRRVMIRGCSAGLLLLACGCARAEPGKAEILAVYEAFIDGDYDVPQRVLLEDATVAVTPAMLGNTPQANAWRGLSPEVRQALEDLVARGRTPRPLPVSVDMSYDDVRISADSARAVHESVRRTETRRLPDGATVMALSAVGFSRDGTVAVVYGSQVCGWLCGSAVVRVIRKHPGGWLAAEEVFAMIS